MSEDNAINESGAAIDAETLQAIASETAPEPEQEFIEAGPDIDQIETFAALLFPLFNTAHKALAPAWGITEQNETVMSQATAQTLLHYYPDMGDNLPPWAELALAGAIVYGPHIGKPRFEKPKEETSEADANAES